MRMSIAFCALCVLYRGAVGAEEEGVAIGFKDVREPTPYEFFNNMDWVCINGGWVAAGSEQAMQMADVNGNGIVDASEWDIFPHDLNDINVRFFPDGTTPQFPPPADFSIARLFPGESERVFLLGDEYVSFGMSNCPYTPAPPYQELDLRRHGYWPQTVKTQFPTIRRQTEVYYDQNICAGYGATPPCTVEWIPRFSAFRGKEYWGLRFYNLIFPVGGVNCSASLIP